jgi:prepilin-type N-terminal cleavage/methylation domain-containing protein
MRSNCQMSRLRQGFGGQANVKSQIRGYSLIEMLVVVFIFSILAIITTQSLVTSLRTTNKTENLGLVRENLDFAMNVMERSIRNAKDLDCASSNAFTLNYTDEWGGYVNFTCDNTGDFIASNSARLTSSDIMIVNCPGTPTAIFACTDGSPGVPDSVTITLIARDTKNAGAESSQVTTTTKVHLRSY